MKLSIAFFVIFFLFLLYNHKQFFNKACKTPNSPTKLFIYTLLLADFNKYLNYLFTNFPILISSACYWHSLSLQPSG